MCSAEKSPQWFVQYVEVNANEDASAFLHRLMLDTHGVIRPGYLGQGPNDERVLSTLLRSVPAILGERGGASENLLALLVCRTDTRPAWRRFTDYSKAVSGGLKEDEDYVLLVDPLVR